MRGDASNRIKAAEDFLVSRGLDRDRRGAGDARVLDHGEGGL
jgi:hypothetical protein